MKIDIIAKDAKGHEVLIAEVRGIVLDDDAAIRTLDYLRELKLPARFGMVADPEWIRIADLENPEDRFVCVLNSKDLLRYYQPDFGEKRIREGFLTTLIEAWLRDIAYRWKSETPPELDQLSAIGLAEPLKDGSTDSEVIIEADPVY